MVRARLVIFLLLISIPAFPGIRRGTLPVYIEDSHAGSFYWIAKNLPLDLPYTLVLFDQHSDASQLLNSDYSRQEIRKARANGTIDSLCHAWRERGFIQCFNWIEPLMPRPFSQVLWVPPPQIPATDYKTIQEKAHKELSCHEEALSRNEGDLSHAYKMCSIQEIDASVGDSRVVVTIDLDYFSLFRGDLKQPVEDVINRVLALKNLAAITVAISTPYLANQNQAHQLFSALIDRLSSVMNATFQFEPFITVGVDRSMKADSLERKGLSIPHLDIMNVPLALKSFFLFLDRRLQVTCETKRWNSLLDVWRKDAQIQLVTLNHKQIECFDSIKVNSRFTWKALVPTQKQYNVAGEQGFSDSSSPFVEYIAHTLQGATGHRTLWLSDVSQFLNDQTGTGTVHVFAEADAGGSTIRSNLVTLQFKSSYSFTGQLSAIVNLPYIYGSSLLYPPNDSDIFGVDCANFIAYGRRSMGFKIPSCNPEQLRHFLQKVGTVTGFDDGRAINSKGKFFILTKELLNDGVILHFGTHVGAIFKDNPPIGILDETDLVIHKLEDEPGVMSLGSMRHTKKPFDVMTFKDNESETTIVPTHRHDSKELTFWGQ